MPASVLVVDDEASIVLSLEFLLKESERLTRLINEVLDLSKIESGALEWHMADVDLAELARDAVAATSQLFRGRGVRLELALPDAAPTVWADRDRLMQVTLNLLSNAVKFSPQDDGRVTLAVTSDLDSITLGVADDGPGIAPEHHAAVFERFRQVAD